MQIHLVPVLMADLVDTLAEQPSTTDLFVRDPFAEHAGEQS
ncbi:hypothetical protein [Streptomyces sp. NBC_01643]|nr:hypothetical protein OHB03_46625 [Streptomyces sp. NBC_01643]